MSFEILLALVVQEINNLLQWLDKRICILTVLVVLLCIDLMNSGELLYIRCQCQFTKWALSFIYSAECLLFHYLEEDMPLDNKVI